MTAPTPAGSDVGPFLCECAHPIIDHFGGCEFCPCRRSHDLALAGLLARALAADRERLARVEALADDLVAFNIEERPDMVPRHVDVLDDYESGVNDAGRRLRAALTAPHDEATP